MFMNNQRDHTRGQRVDSLSCLHFFALSAIFSCVKNVSGAVGCLILLFFGIGAFGGVAFIMKCFIDLFTGKA